MILVDLVLRGRKENQENQGLDSKDRRVIQAIEDVLAYQVRSDSRFAYLLLAVVIVVFVFVLLLLLLLLLLVIAF